MSSCLNIIIGQYIHVNPEHFLALLTEHDHLIGYTKLYLNYGLDLVDDLVGQDREAIRRIRALQSVSRADLSQIRDRVIRDLASSMFVASHLAAIIHKFGVSVDFLRKFRAESVFRCDYKASKLVEPNRDEARAPSGNSSARRGLYICVGAGSQGNVRWDTDGASVMRRAFVRDKTMPGAPRCDEKFPEPGHRF